MDNINKGTSNTAEDGNRKHNLSESSTDSDTNKKRCIELKETALSMDVTVDLSLLPIEVKDAPEINQFLNLYDNFKPKTRISGVLYEMQDMVMSRLVNSKLMLPKESWSAALEYCVETAVPSCNGLIAMAEQKNMIDNMTYVKTLLALFHSLIALLNTFSELSPVTSEETSSIAEDADSASSVVDDESASVTASLAKKGERLNWAEDIEENEMPLSGQINGRRPCDVMPPNEENGSSVPVPDSFTMPNSLIEETVLPKPVAPVTDDHAVGVAGDNIRKADAPPDIRITSLNEYDLSANFGDAEYQMKQRQTKHINDEANRVRANHIRRLQAQFKGTRGTCVIFSKSMENHSSRDMADNAWASLRKSGLKNNEFKVGEANSAYLAILSFSDPQKMEEAIAQGNIEHWRYMGDKLAKKFDYDKLYIQDLRVEREEFIVTGADDHTWDITSNALKQTWEKLYPGCRVTIRRGTVTMRCDFGDGIEEEERDTLDMNVTVHTPFDRNYVYPAGPVSIKLSDETTRDLEVRSKGYSIKCIKCGGSQEECRRQVDGKLIWACKKICYYCQTPLFEGHTEAHCADLKNTEEGKRKVSDIRRSAFAWQNVVQRDNANNPIDLTRANAVEAVRERAEVPSRVVSKFVKEHEKIRDESNIAAAQKINPYKNERAEQQAKVREVKQSYATACATSSDPANFPPLQVKYTTKVTQKGYSTSQKRTVTHSAEFPKQFILRPLNPVRPGNSSGARQLQPGERNGNIGATTKKFYPGGRINGFFGRK